ncbi:HNH endonuclease signature motif containing protein [Rhizocola hellebori]|uniref:HNH endonuclease signature motif containing protein n=1 Tax=Rhizocola hellebori TaxID=1392758 RepID=UPI001942F4F3|nr:HNH endonuclease signature motif containing protein [Rhizocola hellebori]
MFDAGVVDTGVVDRLIARARLLAQINASMLADLVAVADATPHPEFAGFEVSAALILTGQAADVQLELAHTIVRRLPAVHAAMSAGDIDLPRARVIADAVCTLDLDLARDIVKKILPQAPALTTGALRVRLAKLVIQADPQAAAKRHRKRIRDRRVELQNTEDSCATLLGMNLPADTALAASNRLTSLARAVKQAGDPRSLDQLRADTFLNLLLGNTCGHPRFGAPHGNHRSTSSSCSGTGTGTGTGTGSSGCAGTGASGGGTGTGSSGTSSTSGGRSGVHGGGMSAGGTGAGGSGTGVSGSGVGNGTGGVSGRGGVSGGGGTCGGDCCGCCGNARDAGSGAGRPRSGGVELTGDLEMLARLSEEPGNLAGYGPVIADIARQVAQQQRHSPWTFTIRDPNTGEIFTGATRRRPTEAMARHVRARDRTCRAPGCRRPAIYADIDHTIPYHLGGLTVVGNLGVLCRYHHRAKHEGWWLLVQVRPGVFVWRSPLGRRYTVYPSAP